MRSTRKEESTMTRFLSLVIPLALLGTASGTDALAGPEDDCRKRTVFTETFEGGKNEGGWSFGISDEAILEEDGSHGDVLVTTACLGTSFCLVPDQPLVTFAPRARTGKADSEFGGDLRARGVTRVGADFRLYRVNTGTYQERPLSLVLVNFNGTPEDPTDDLYVCLVGRRNIPTPSPEGNGGWGRYDFDLPTSSPTLPTPRSEVEGDFGWVAAEGDIFTPALDPDAVWNAVVEDVDQMIFWWHDPRFFAILQNWKVAMDNASIVSCAD
jgi:hypothetical protein